MATFEVTEVNISEAHAITRIGAGATSDPDVFVLKFGYITLADKTHTEHEQVFLMQFSHMADISAAILGVIAMIGRHEEFMMELRATAVEPGEPTVIIVDLPGE